MNAALYVRVSTQEQAKEGYSVGAQAELLTNYAKAHKWKIYNTYIDDGYSGKDMNRPAFQNLVADIKKGRVDIVVVWMFDRISRSQKDMLTIIEDILEPNNCAYVSLCENFDTSTQTGKAMTGFFAIFAQLEREQIKERMALGREARAKEGYYTGGGNNPPYGYTYKDGILHINPYEAMVVKRIYELCLERKAPYTIAKILTQEGYKARYKVWVYQTILKILSSRVYIGEVSFAKKWYEGKHEPIIDIETFEAANKIYNERRKFTKDFYSNAGKASSYFAGYLWCGRCGKKVYKQSNGSTKDNKPIRINYFKCQGRSHFKYSGFDKPCDLPYYKLEELEEQLLNELRKLAIEPGYFEKVRKASNLEDNTKVIKGEIKKVDSQISRLADLYSMGSMPFEILDSKLKDLNEKRQALMDQLSDAADQKEITKKTKKIERTVKKIPDILDSGSFDDIRNVIEMLIDKIVLDGENIEFYWRF